MVINSKKINLVNQVNEMEAKGKADERDPDGLNKNLKIEWNALIGEKDALKSPDWIWKISSNCFNFTEIWCYKILSVIFAPFLAFLIAIFFSILAFMRIWIFNPFNKFFLILSSSVRTFIEILINGLFGPFFETIGLCLSHLRLRHQKIHDAKDESQFPFII